MNELAFVKEFASLGLGAVIAVVVLVWKRNDDKKYETELCNVTNRMIKVIEDITQVNTSLKESVDLLVENLLEVRKKKS